MRKEGQRKKRDSNPHRSRLHPMLVDRSVSQSVIEINRFSQGERSGIEKCFAHLDFFVSDLDDCILFEGNLL